VPPLDDAVALPPAPEVEVELPTAAVAVELPTAAFELSTAVAATAAVVPPEVTLAVVARSAGAPGDSSLLQLGKRAATNDATTGSRTDGEICPHAVGRSVRS